MNYECLNPQGSAAVELQVLVDYQITDQKKTDWISKITIITSALDVMCGVILSVNTVAQKYFNEMFKLCSCVESDHVNNLWKFGLHQSLQGQLNEMLVENWQKALRGPPGHWKSLGKQVSELTSVKHFTHGLFGHFKCKMNSINPYWIQFFETKLATVETLISKLQKPVDDVTTSIFYTAYAVAWRQLMK